MKSTNSTFITILVSLLPLLKSGNAFGVPQSSRSPIVACNHNNNKGPSTRFIRLSMSDNNNDKNNNSDGKLSRLKNLLGRLSGNNNSSSKQTLAVDDEETSTLETATKSVRTVANNIVKPLEEIQEQHPLEPMEQAKRLRSAAEKARLEAERMDVELTLEKIARLEQELTKPKADVETLQKQLTALQRKLTDSTSSSGISVKTMHTPVASSATTTSAASAHAQVQTDTSTVSKHQPARSFRDTELSKMAEPLDEESLKGLMEELEQMPKFLLKTVALTVGETADDNGNFNITALAIKMDASKRFDFSHSPKAVPVFTAEQIAEREAMLKEDVFVQLQSPLMDKAAGNSTKQALLTLEYEYYLKDETLVDRVLESTEWLQLFNKSRVDTGIEALYPACTRRSEIPTEDVMERFMKQVLPKTEFVPSGPFEKMESGYIVRGTVKRENANVVESIDRALGPLAEKMTVLYTPDFTVYMEDEDSVDDPFLDPVAREPILYVVGLEVTREPKPIQLGIASSLGLATSWYLSIYPFLFNSGIAKRVDEDLALVDAGLQPDLLWLTDLSVPLFASFMSILLAHEMGHIIAAGIHKFKTTVPTFVPSLITGVTSTVTTFKTLPPTKNAMFDFGLAGPAFGGLASVAALVVGSQLTLTGDPTYFPALPLAILRQSTLGGGIIDYILGGGTLYVPEGALGTSAVAEMTIPLHPIALAGYIGLIVNALGLLPIGTTDGGRIALALFGRPAKLAVGNITMFALLVAGVLGSDLFLFYFAFCLAFQSGNEVPARNEVEKVDLTRVVAATGAYMIVLLALIPFQI